MSLRQGIKKKNNEKTLGCIVSSINFDQNIHSDAGNDVFEADWFSQIIILAI